MKFTASLALAFSSLTWLALGCLASAAAAVRARAQPPAWPDPQPVANGCYPSTAAYLARLRVEFPAVAARAETVRLPSGKLHTIAVVNWRGQTWLRDLFIGIAPVRRDVQASFEAALTEWRRQGGRHSFRERVASTMAERRLEVQAAAEIVAALHPQIIEVLAPGGPRPVLWWTTAEGELALYEPTVGTAVGFTRRTPAEVAVELMGAPPVAHISFVSG